MFGAGTIGLLVAAMAKLSGATTVLISDVDSGRIQYALHHGFATKGYLNSRSCQLTDLSDKLVVAKETAAEMMDIACANQPDAEGADVTFDCTGKEICVQTGLYVSVLILFDISKVEPHLLLDDEARRSTCDGGNGYSNPNSAFICSTPERD